MDGSAFNFGCASVTFPFPFLCFAFTKFVNGSLLDELFSGRRVTVAFGLGFGFHFSSVCSLTVSGLGFSGGFWVDGGWSRGSWVDGGFWLGFWSRRGGGAVGLGFGVGLHPVGHRFAVGLRWVLGFGVAVGLLWGCRGFDRGVAVGLGGFEVGLGFWGCRGVAVGLGGFEVGLGFWGCRGVAVGLGLPWVCRGVAMGLPWVWESTAKKKKKKKNEEREKENEEREKKS
uniref:Uncharacterized protein n=1 Tax=Fagus sylvatica TaxID=28930 RepID=A0A2N9IIJ5_FAGSY